MTNAMVLVPVKIVKLIAKLIRDVFIPKVGPA